MGFNIDTSAIERALEEFSRNSENAISTLCSTGALEMESYAKLHRPWTDRTGQARQRLTGRVDHEIKTKWVITLSHGVDYGLWLENAHEQKYAIVKPTVLMKSNDIMNSFQGLLDNLSSRL